MVNESDEPAPDTETGDEAEQKHVQVKPSGPYRPLLVTPEQEQRIRQVSEDADRLEKFTDTEKKLLRILIRDTPELHELAERRRGKALLWKKLKSLLLQISAGLTLLIGLNEILTNYFRWREAVLGFFEWHGGK